MLLAFVYGLVTRGDLALKILATSTCVTVFGFALAFLLPIIWASN